MLHKPVESMPAGAYSVKQWYTLAFQIFTQTSMQKRSIFTSGLKL